MKATENSDENADARAQASPQAIAQASSQASSQTSARGGRASQHALLFTAIGASGLVILVLLYAVIVRMSIFDNGFHIAFAMFLGVLGTAGLGFALMSLVFYSARTGADEAVSNSAGAGWRDADES